MSVPKNDCSLNKVGVEQLLVRIAIRSMTAKNVTELAKLKALNLNYQENMIVGYLTENLDCAIWI